MRVPRPNDRSILTPSIRQRLSFGRQSAPGTEKSECESESENTRFFFLKTHSHTHTKQSGESQSECESLKLKIFGTIANTFISFSSKLTLTLTQNRVRVRVSKRVSPTNFYLFLKLWAYINLFFIVYVLCLYLKIKI